MYRDSINILNHYDVMICKSFNITVPFEWISLTGGWIPSKASFGVSIVNGAKKLLNKHVICWWFETRVALLW